MPTRAENFFDSLTDESTLSALVGRTEDGDFDCKEWHGLKSSQHSLAKAAVGFANATGGVIILGIRAKKQGNEPDVIVEMVSILDPQTAESEALDVLLKLVEPGLEGVRSKVIFSSSAGQSGYVVMFIPASDGPPNRSKADWKFYVRIASGTVPMEYFQIVDRFGRRPNARLVPSILEVKVRRVLYDQNSFERIAKIGLRNDGRGIARFPCLSFRTAQGLHLVNSMLGNDNALWPLSNIDSATSSLRGGVNDVIYPGEMVRVATFSGRGVVSSNPLNLIGGQPIGYPASGSTITFAKESLVLDVVCEGMPVSSHTFSLEDDDVPVETVR